MMMFLFSLIVALIPAAQSPKPGPPPVSATSRANWLVGCWQSTGEQVVITRESWTRAGADMLVATVTKSVPGSLAEYSFLRIESATDGSARLISQNAGERPVAFTMEAASPVNELSFRGADRRIMYLLGKKGETLLVRNATDAAKASEMLMKKVDCK